MESWFIVIVSVAGIYGFAWLMCQDNSRSDYKPLADLKAEVWTIGYCRNPFDRQVCHLENIETLRPVVEEIVPRYEELSLRKYNDNDLRKLAELGEELENMKRVYYTSVEYMDYLQQQHQLAQTKQAAGLYLTIK